MKKITTLAFALSFCFSMLTSNSNASTANNSIAISTSIGTPVSQNALVLSSEIKDEVPATPELAQAKKKTSLFGHRKPVINSGGIYLSAGAIIIIVLLLILIL